MREHSTMSVEMMFLRFIATSLLTSESIGLNSFILRLFQVFDRQRKSCQSIIQRLLDVHSLFMSRVANLFLRNKNGDDGDDEAVIRVVRTVFHTSLFSFYIRGFGETDLFLH